MKRFIALSIALLVSAPALAWEVPGNPDRFPSFAFTYSAGSAGGEGRALKTIGAFGIPTEVEVQGSEKNWALLPSFRLPFNNHVTLELGAEYTIRETTFTGSFTDDKQTMRGTAWHATYRYYFHK